MNIITMVLIYLIMEMRIYSQNKKIKELVNQHNVFVNDIGEYVSDVKNQVFKHVDGMQDSVEAKINEMDSIRRSEVNINLNTDDLEKSIIKALDGVEVTLGYSNEFDDLDLDTILDKINEKGFDSLTKEEVEFLDKNKNN